MSFCYKGHGEDNWQNLMWSEVEDTARYSSPCSCMYVGYAELPALEENTLKFLGVTDHQGRNLLSHGLRKKGVFFVV